ncbi:MAG: hypothetical protein R2716_00685 [Microthrixaceae bacterium]
MARAGVQYRDRGRSVLGDRGPRFEPHPGRGPSPRRTALEPGCRCRDVRTGELYRDYHHKEGFARAELDAEVVDWLSGSGLVRQRPSAGCRGQPRDAGDPALELPD